MTHHVAETKAPAPAASAAGAGAAASGAPKRRRYSPFTRRDRIALTLMVGVPTFLVVVFIALPTLASIALSFTAWTGIGGLDTIQFVGLKNYQNLGIIPVSLDPIEFKGVYRPFWPAVQNNILWLAWFTFIATPIGMFLAVILDKNIRGTRIYQSALYMPVVLSLAIVGFIWILIYSGDQGLINNVLGTTSRSDNFIDWLGNRDINIFAILVAASWRHVGYVMILYLAGLKSVDPSLREAAQIDGANERQTFRFVVFPVMRPINIVVLVITVIESLRAFDLAYIINRGLNGLELLSILVTNNIIGEASRVGFGSAIGVVLLVVSVGPIILFLVRAMREPQA
ncbi:MAG: carbohydrate ABC transporter permease [Chloroflexota bacterium]